MLKYALVLAVLLGTPAISQEMESPRIEPEPRWDVEAIRDYFRGKDGSKPGAQTPPEPSALPPLPLSANPKTLLHGLSPEAVISKLGKPVLDRRDGRVRVLQYSDRMCVLDIILWRKQTATSFTVQHVESRTLKAEKSDLTSCLQKHYAARGLTYEVAAAPIPPAPMAPAPVAQNGSPTPPAAPDQPAVIPPAPKPPQPAPGLSYPLGGQQQPPK